MFLSGFKIHRHRVHRNILDIDVNQLREIILKTISELLESIIIKIKEIK
jgi:hypothetical protein